MTRFERSQDLALIQRIITNPLIYPHVTRDDDPKREDFRAQLHPDVTYLLVKHIPGPDQGPTRLLGLWTLIEAGSDIQIHTCLLPISFPRARQARAEAALDVIEWVWGNTKAERLVTNVPAYNKLARRFAEAAGMKHLKTKVASYLKGGVMYDEQVLGLERPTCP